MKVYGLYTNYDMDFNDWDKYLETLYISKELAEKEALRIIEESNKIAQEKYDRERRESDSIYREGKWRGRRADENYFYQLLTNPKDEVFIRMGLNEDIQCYYSIKELEVMEN